MNVHHAQMSTVVIKVFLWFIGALSCRADCSRQQQARRHTVGFGLARPGLGNGTLIQCYNAVLQCSALTYSLHCSSLQCYRAVLH